MMIFPPTSLLLVDFSIQFMATLPFSLFRPKPGSIPNSCLSLTPHTRSTVNPLGSTFNIHPEPNHFSPPPGLPLQTKPPLPSLKDYRNSLLIAFLVPNLPSSQSAPNKQPECLFLFLTFYYGKTYIIA